MVRLVIIALSHFFAASLQLSSKDVYCNPYRCPSGTIHIACEYEVIYFLLKIKIRYPEIM